MVAEATEHFAFYGLGVDITDIPRIAATIERYGNRFIERIFTEERYADFAALWLLGLIVVKILAPGFYARQNVVTPVKIGLVTLAATQAMNFAFVGTLKHTGLALAIGLATVELFLQSGQGLFFLAKLGFQNLAAIGVTGFLVVGRHFLARTTASSRFRCAAPLRHHCLDHRDGRAI